MKYYVLVIAPMDSVFVGPFDSCTIAMDYRPGDHYYRVMPESEMRENIRQYGEIPIQLPNE